ncbi:MAG: S41 family peptidase [Flavobacteriales bacterium]|nr:S41 family peptidase [Flavobacteriales bacterium]
MRNIILIIFLFPTLTFAQVKRGSVKKQLKDFEVFEKVLVAKEGRLDLHQSADTMYHYLSELESSLSEEKDLLEQYRLYSSTLSKLGCGHTQIHPTTELLRAWLSSRKSVPFDLIIQGKKLYTGKIDSDDYDVVNMNGANEKLVKKIKGNYEVLSMNHQTFPEMMEKIAPYLSSDEDKIDFKYHQASELFEFYRHLSDPYDLDSVQVIYVKGSDTISAYFQLGAAPVNTINERLEESASEDAVKQEEIGTFHIEKSKVGVFRFRSFTACTGKEYNAFLEKSFRKIQSKKIEKVIVDLRGNTGGIMQYDLMRYFVGEDVELGRYVVEKPKKFFETTHLKKRNGDYRRHKWMSRVQRLRKWMNTFEDGIVRTTPIDDDLVFDGDIVVITDESTFSSASILACHLKTLCDAKLVGRPAGGSFYRGNAGTLVAVLPNSKFRLLVNPNTFYSHLPDSTTPTEIKVPDLLIEPDYLVPRKVEKFYLKAAMEAFE